jgi:hypothetical protein
VRSLHLPHRFLDGLVHAQRVGTLRRRGYKVTPLSTWGKEPAPVQVKIDPTVDMKTPPKVQVDTMPAEKFFAYAAEIMKLQPPHLTDEPIVAQMRRIGIEPGKSLDFDGLAPAVKQRLRVSRRCTATHAVEGAHAGQGREPVVDEYRHDGRVRQLLSEASHHRPGRSRRAPSGRRHLPAQSRRRRRQATRREREVHDPLRQGSEPPANAFWSITLYDSDGFQVANSLNRFAVSSWMPFRYNPDGSLDLYFQNESPGADKQANWLPAPKGSFNLTMRLYAPKSEALTGRWNPPPVTKVQEPTRLHVE